MRQSGHINLCQIRVRAVYSSYVASKELDGVIFELVDIVLHPILPLDAKEVSALDIWISVTLYLYGDLRADVSLEGERNLLPL